MRSKMSSSRWRSLSTCAQLGSRSPRETPGARPIPTLKGGSAGTNAAQTRSGFPGRDKFSSRSRTTSKPVGAALQHPPPPPVRCRGGSPPASSRLRPAPPAPFLLPSPTPSLASPDPFAGHSPFSPLRHLSKRAVFHSPLRLMNASNLKSKNILLGT